MEKPNGEDVDYQRFNPGSIVNKNECQRCIDLESRLNIIQHKYDELLERVLSRAGFGDVLSRVNENRPTQHQQMPRPIRTPSDARAHLRNASRQQAVKDRIKTLEESENIDTDKATDVTN